MPGYHANNGASDSDATVMGTPYKRPFDLALIAVFGILLAPMWLALWTVIPLAIWLEDRGRVFLVQRRVGRGGQPFDMIKFRTMVEDAERLTGPVLAAESDVRSTKVGALLRRLHLDEIPQIINVVKGEMSLVGPRPERPELAQEISLHVPEFGDRLRVRPGIAGLAQAQGTYHTHPRSKLRYDRLYIDTMGPLVDLKLLGLCLWKAVKAASRLQEQTARRQSGARDA